MRSFSLRLLRFLLKSLLLLCELLVVLLLSSNFFVMTVMFRGDLLIESLLSLFLRLFFLLQLFFLLVFFLLVSEEAKDA